MSLETSSGCPTTCDAALDASRSIHSFMGKRPASRDDDDEVDREAECRGTLRALNAQFASWVSTRAVESPIVSWAEGCRDYLKHLDALKVRSRRETTFGGDDGRMERSIAMVSSRGGGTRTTDEGETARAVVIFRFARAERLRRRFGDDDDVRGG